MGIETKNAIITGSSLTTEDHGILSAWITLDYGGSGQGFGGYVLYSPNKTSDANYAGHFIWRVMEVAGVGKWSDLHGKTVRVRGDHAGIESIGHIVKDMWFCPRKEFGGMEK